MFYDVLLSAQEVNLNMSALEQVDLLIIKNNLSGVGGELILEPQLYDKAILELTQLYKAMGQTLNHTSYRGVKFIKQQ